MDLRLVLGALVALLLFLLTGPTSAEFIEREATTAHRQELFSTDIYRRKPLRHPVAQTANPFVERTQAEAERMQTPQRVIETSGSGNNEDSSALE